ncbi:TPA: terminase small subunit, partial [Salmonella enterica]|nr:terminase small subunit [Salmonella enterica]
KLRKELAGDGDDDEPTPVQININVVDAREEDGDQPDT